MLSAFAIEVPGLPRCEGGEFHPVWLKNCDGTLLVPAGSFHELERAVAWAGVSTDDFPLITVTREEVAAPKDAAQGSSDEVVAAGSVAPCQPDSTCLRGRRRRCGFSSTPSACVAGRPPTTVVVPRHKS